MRRLLLTLLLTGAFGLMLFTTISSKASQPLQQQPTVPPTNTPRPTFTATATVPPTNTPRPTMTHTLTATFTPTFTPTDTPSPTVTPSPTNTPTNTPTPSPTPTIVGPNEYPDNFNPLTGLPYPNDEARDRRTLIVKVSNFPEIVRPQSGLDKADVVFEYEVEGAVTRFAALFRSQGSDHVGSVRSARLLDLELVPMFEALFAYSGANDWIYQYILASDWRWRALTPQMGVNDPFGRFPQEGKAYEHTLFADTFKLWDVATEYQVNDGRQFRGFAFSDTPDPGGEPAVDIFVDFWSPRQDTRWQYNAEDGRYYRWNNGLPHTDAITGKQLAADNIVILEAEYVDRPDILDSETSGVVLETYLWGVGTAWLFRNGQWYQGEWYHTQGKLGLWLTFPGGETSMHLKPGQTWIEVVRPVMYGVEVSDTYADMDATAAAIYATATQSYAATATAIAPYITPPPITMTPTPLELP